MNSGLDKQLIENRFLEELSHHMEGLKIKVNHELCEENYWNELSALQGDRVYSQFGLARPEYVLIRFMGRISVSIGRRLGEIYDKIPRFVASARFGIDIKEISPKLNGLELDMGLQFQDISMEDVNEVRGVTSRYVTLPPNTEGIGIEIRYNFNPNDSARLRKDEEMGEYVLDQRLVPIYLVFSSISPRIEAIERLKRAGWNFLIGEDAIKYAQELFGLDLAGILEQTKVREQVELSIDETMSAMINSFAFQQVLKLRN